jgi:hypothetical protein
MAMFDAAIFDSAIFDTGAATGVSGTSVVTLGGVTPSGAGTVAVKGSSSVTLGGVGQSAAGAVPVKGTSSVTLAGVTPSGAGTVAVKGSSAVTLGGVGQSAAGAVPVKGTSAVTLAGITPSGAGAVTVNGSSAVTLAGAALTAAGQVGSTALSGTGFAILEGVLQSAFGSVSTPAAPPFDWQPPLEPDSSAIIGQALRFMRMPPLRRFAPEAELRSAVADAFGTSIDDCLAAADWSFASTLAILSPASPDVVADAALPVIAMLPGDLIRLRQVWPAGARWRIDGSALRADTPAPITIRYTARVTREEVLPASFKTAVALSIAVRLGARWAGGTIDPKGLADMAVLTLKLAMREDSRQAAATRALPAGGLGYGLDTGQAGDAGDWALEATR